MTWNRVHVAALIAILGTTISPYLFFWQASEEVEELEESGAEGTSTPLDIGHLRHMRQDVLTGMASAVVVMFSIMVASGATLGKQGIATVQTADQAAQALKPIAGQFASLLFTLGIVGTGLLAVPVLAGSTAYALAEAFEQPEGLSKPVPGGACVLPDHRRGHGARSRVELRRPEPGASPCTSRPSSTGWPPRR